MIKQGRIRHWRAKEKIDLSFCNKHSGGLDKEGTIHVESEKCSYQPISLQLSVTEAMNTCIWTPRYSCTHPPMRSKTRTCI